MDPDSICGAKRRSDGSICRNPAGKGTRHLGDGRCYLHDGSAEDVRRKVLEVTTSDPELRDRALELLDSPDLLNFRAEIAVLKARFEQIQIRQEDADVSDLRLTANTISKMVERHRAIQRAKQHYIHVTVVSSIVKAFAQIGRDFLPDPETRGRFVEEVERVIRKDLDRSSARAIAAHAVTPETETEIEVPAR